MDKKLIKAIEEHLPAMQMQTLRDNLDELDGLRAQKIVDDNTIKQLRETNGKSHEKIIELEKTVSKLEAQREAATNAKNIAETETRNHKIEALNNEVKVAQAELAGVKDTVSAFLKNTIIRESRQHGITVENPQTNWNPTTQRMEPTGYMNKSVVPTEDTTTKEAS